VPTGSRWGQEGGYGASQGPGSTLKLVGARADSDLSLFLSMNWNLAPHFSFFFHFFF
jgi:hypothetical protein